MKYKVLTNQDEGFELADRSGRTIKLLRLLQVKSAYYTDVYRYGIAKEQCINGIIENEEKQGENISFEIVEAEIGADEFRDEVAKLLFPSAPVEENIDYIDYAEVEEGLDAFLNFIEPRYRKRNGLLASLGSFPVEQIGSTSPETQTDGL